MLCRHCRDHLDFCFRKKNINSCIMNWKPKPTFFKIKKNLNSSWDSLTLPGKLLKSQREKKVCSKFGKKFEKKKKSGSLMQNLEYYTFYIKPVSEFRFSCSHMCTHKKSLHIS